MTADVSTMGGVLNNKDFVSGMKGLGLGGGLGSSGGGGGFGGGAGDAASMGLGIAAQGVGIVNAVDSIIMRHKALKESKRQFDQQFNENVRQFGLEFALKDYATRKGVSFQIAQQLYNSEVLGMSKQAQTENLKTSALGRNIQSTQFGWEKEDRKKKQNIGTAMQKGLVMGLLGGK